MYEMGSNIFEDVWLSGMHKWKLLNISQGMSDSKLVQKFRTVGTHKSVLSKKWAVLQLFILDIGFETD